MWRHGDWVRVTPRGSLRHLRAQRLHPQPRRRPDGHRRLLRGRRGLRRGRRLAGDRHHRAGRARRGRAAVLPRAGRRARALEDVEPGLRKALRSELSPRHVPDRFVVVDAIPRTLNGKKCEVPVKKILAGVAPEKAVSRGALQNPDALGPLPRPRGPGGVRRAGRPCVVLWSLEAPSPREASPSPVYGAALLMRFGVNAPPGFESRSLRAARPARPSTTEDHCARSSTDRASDYGSEG